jgi:hypothetical protein
MVMDDQGGAMAHSRAAAVMMGAQSDAAAHSRAAGKEAMDAQPDAAGHSRVAAAAVMAAQLDVAAHSRVAATAVKVVQCYPTESTLSPEHDRDGEIQAALAIHAHYAEIRDAPVEALNENHPVYDPARPLPVTRGVNVDQRCGPASSDRRMPHLVHHSSSLPSSLPFFLPSFLPFLHASPEVLSVQPGENREHARGARVVEPARQCDETEMCR